MKLALFLSFLFSFLEFSEGKFDACSDTIPCADGSFCNFDDKTAGVCESCSDYSSERKCGKDGLPWKGAQECKKVCFESTEDGDCSGFFSDFPNCKKKINRIVSKRDSAWFVKRDLDGSRCSIQQWYFEKDQSCPEVDDDDDDDEDDDDEGDACSDTIPCADGSFCNFDDKTAGFCESCSDFSTERKCGKDGLPWKGAQECKKVCFPCDACSDTIPCADGSFCNFDDKTAGCCESCSDFSTKTKCGKDGLPWKGAQECKKVCFP